MGPRMNDSTRAKEAAVNTIGRRWKQTLWLAAFAAPALPAAADSAPAPRDGAQVYAKVCGHCHEAGVGPVIRGRSLPEVYIRQVVRHGNRAMPAFRPAEIADAELAGVARFVGTQEVAR